MESGPNPLGEALRAWRASHGLTQVQVAAMVGAAAGRRGPVHFTIVSQVETGRLTPSVEIAAAIGRVVGIGADEATMMIAEPVNKTGYQYD